MQPEVRFEHLTEDQAAMLELLGSPPEVAPRMTISFFEPSPPGIGMIASGLSENFVSRRPCPVVNVLGQDRMVMPNGDLHAIHRDDKKSDER